MAGPAAGLGPVEIDPKRTSKLSQSVIAKFAGAMPDFTVGVMSDWSWTSI